MTDNEEKTEKAIAERNLLGFLGLCRRAGKVICGTPLICRALAAREKPALVLCSAEASAATKKRLTTKCAFYQTPLCVLEVPLSRLAAAVGKTDSLAAVAVTDPGFAGALEKKAAALSPSAPR